MNEEGGGEFGIMPSGVPNLDIVLGGGIPVGSFNLIAGGPGVGKTVLSQQIMFANATPERPALHFTVLGEPVAKLLRYQSRLSFFDASKLNTAIRYVDIGDVIRKEGLERGLEVIVSRVERYAPVIVVVDSVRAVREIARREGEYGLRSFAHDLAQVAVVWNTTSFMVGEYEETELRAGAEFTLADGIIWLKMDQCKNSVVRKLQVIKSRGMPIIEGLNSFRIDSDGVYVYSRYMPFAFILPPTLHDRLAFGVAGLDRMMEGGIPRGEACLIAGASGTGKTVLSQHFIAEGVRQGEPTVAMIFEENPEEYATKAARFGWDFHAWEREGKMALIYGRPYGLTLDEVADRLRGAAARLGAKRVVIDSISGMDMARSPADNSDFREVLLHLVAEFKAHRITLVATTEISELFGELRLTSERVSPIADNVILLRHVEIQSELLEVIGVIKMRGSGHDRDLRHFRITSRGARVGPPFHEYTGLLSGVPTMVAVMGPQPFAPGLEAHQSTLVQAIFGLGTATEEEMIAETGYPKEEVERLVRELVNTGYLVRETVDDRTVYHVSMVTWAPSVRQAPRGTVRRGGGPRRDER